MELLRHRTRSVVLVGIVALICTQGGRALAQSGPPATATPSVKPVLNVNIVVQITEVYVSSKGKASTKSLQSLTLTTSDDQESKTDIKGKDGGWQLLVRPHINPDHSINTTFTYLSQETVSKIPTVRQERSLTVMRQLRLHIPRRVGGVASTRNSSVSEAIEKNLPLPATGKGYSVRFIDAIATLSGFDRTTPVPPEQAQLSQKL